MLDYSFKVSRRPNFVPILRSNSYEREYNENREFFIIGRQAIKRTREIFCIFFLFLPFFFSLYGSVSVQGFRWNLG